MTNFRGGGVVRGIIVFHTFDILQREFNKFKGGGEGEGPPRFPYLDRISHDTVLRLTWNAVK